MGCTAYPRELLKLGLDVAEITVSRHMPQRPVDPDKVKRWIAFLRNHTDGIIAMDFFAVPTASLRMQYVLFVIEHGRRRIVHFSVTPNPASAWVIQQLREAFPYDTVPPASPIRSGHHSSRPLDTNRQSQPKWLHINLFGIPMSSITSQTSCSNDCVNVRKRTNAA